MTFRKKSILELYAEHHLAQKAREREQAEAAAKAAAEAAALALAPKPVPVTEMRSQPSRISLGGFSFKLPAGFAFHDVDMSIECDGQPVTLKIKRRELSETDELAPLFDAEVDAACQSYADLRIIRRYDCLFGGSEAKAVDFSFMAGAQNRHGRLVGAIVPLLGADQRQWLSVLCVMDASQPSLATWLIHFDDMLAAVADA